MFTRGERQLQHRHWMAPSTNQSGQNHRPPAWRVEHSNSKAILKAIYSPQHPWVRIYHPLQFIYKANAGAYSKQTVQRKTAKLQASAKTLQTMTRSGLLHPGSHGPNEAKDLQTRELKAKKLVNQQSPSLMALSTAWSRLSSTLLALFCSTIARIWYHGPPTMGTMRS